MSSFGKRVGIMAMTQAGNWCGKTIAEGRFEVMTLLGEGGMGQAYRARDRKYERDVVIKVPHLVLLRDPEFAKRFQREIESLRRLAHPHIVPVLCGGLHSGIPYVVLRYMPDGSLAEKIESSSLSERLALLPTWLPQIADALDFVHDQGFIHRDVKPDNIFFDDREQAYLGDFGIVKTASEATDSREGTRLTMTGTVIGTPEYMAPEMAMGEDYDRRSDQYSLAVTAYESLDGATPFQGPTPAAILVKLTTTNVPDLSTKHAGIPTGLSIAVSRGLSKEPQDRFDVCSEFASAVTLHDNVEHDPASSWQETTPTAAFSTTATHEIRPSRRRVKSHDTSLVESETFIAASVNPARLRLRRARKQYGLTKIVISLTFLVVLMAAPFYFWPEEQRGGVSEVALNVPADSTTDARAASSADSSHELTNSPIVSSATSDEAISGAQSGYSSERRAALWVLSTGGAFGRFGPGFADEPEDADVWPDCLTVECNGVLLDVDTLADLPSNPFIIRSINLRGTLIQNADLKRLTELSGLRRLRLDGTGVSDEGLSCLRDLPLVTLDLASTHLTNAGIDVLASLSDLKHVDVSSTKIDSAGFSRLARLPQLESLTAGRIWLDPAAVASLKNAAHLKSLAVGPVEDRDAAGAVFASMSGLEELDLRHLIADAALLQMISGLRLRTLVLSCGERSQTAYQPILQMASLRKLDLAHSSFPKESVGDLAKLTGLRKLILPFSSSCRIGPAEVAQLARLKDLRLLKMYLENTASFDGSIGNLSNLRSLHVSQGKFPDAFFSGIEQLRKLRHLSLSGNFTGSQLQSVKFSRFLQHCSLALRSAEKTSLAEVAASLSECRDLRSLTISASFREGASGRAIVASIPPQPKLRHLYLMGPVDDSIVPWLQQSTQLRSLTLRSTKVSGAGVRQITGLKRLESLSLGYLVIQDSDVEWLSHLSRLRSLDLSWTAVSDATVMKLNSRQLSVLNLEGCPVGDQSLARVRNSPSMTMLSLGQNTTDAGLSALGSLPNLRYMNLSYTRTNGTGLAGLKRFPALTTVKLSRWTSKECYDRLPEISKLTSLYTGAADVHPSAIQLNRCRSLRYVSIKSKEASGSSTDVDRLNAAVPNINVRKNSFSEHAVSPVWKFTTSSPGSVWMGVNVDDSKWLSARGGFGDSPRVPGEQTYESTWRGVCWPDSDLWLRNRFSVSGSTDDVALRFYGVANVDIYINGIRIGPSIEASEPGLQLLPISSSLLNSGQENFIAAFCRGSTQERYVDLDLVRHQGSRWISLLTGAERLPREPVGAPSSLTPASTGASAPSAPPATSALRREVRFTGISYGTIPSLKYSAEGPITIELITAPDDPRKNQTLFANFQHAGLGIELYNGRWSFAIHDGTDYRRVLSDELAVPKRRVHLAACWDLNEARLFVDGKRQKGVARLFGRHGTSALPFMFGADPTPSGGPEHFFTGTIQAIHVSNGTRYRTESYTISQRFAADSKTVALFDFSRSLKRSSVSGTSQFRRSAQLYRERWETNR